MAEQPEIPIDFNARMKDGSITVREALSLVADSTSDKTKAGKDNIKKTRNLISQLADEGIDVDQPYFDVYKTRKFNAALDPLERADGVNRWQEWIWFERRFKDRVEDAGRNEPFTLLGGDKGYAQRTYELVGVQSRGADPMRGTLFSEDLDRIYNEALNQDTYEKVTKTGKTVTVDIDPETRDYLIYEKYTGQRLASNIDKDTGLKITDINFGTDANGNLIAEVAGKTVGKKTRPEAMYDGEFAHFLKAKVDRARAALPEGADPSQANLFQTTDGKLDALWNATIRPKLEAEFSAILPRGKQGSRSVIRKILARQLLVEYKFPKDAVKAWMGHAGAEMSGSGDILTESYTGQVPDDRIGGMTNTLIRNDARNAGTSTVNQLFLNRRVDVPDFYGESSVIFSTPDTIDIASASQPAKGRDPLPGELQELNETARSNALDLEMANIDKEKRNLQKRKENQAVEEETIRQKVREKYFAKQVEQDELAKIAAETGEDIDAGAEKNLTTEPSEKLSNKMAKFGIRLGRTMLGPLGLGLTTAAAVTTGTAVRQRAEAMGIPAPLAKTAGVVAGASEFLPVPPSDVAEVQPDPFSMRPVERAAAESEIVREGLKTTGQLQEVAPRETRKAAPAPIDDSFLTMSP